MSLGVKKTEIHTRIHSLLDDKSVFSLFFVTDSYSEKTRRVLSVYEINITKKDGKKRCLLGPIPNSKIRRIYIYSSIIVQFCSVHLHRYILSVLVLHVHSFYSYRLENKIYIDRPQFKTKKSKSI